MDFVVMWPALILLSAILGFAIWRMSNTEPARTRRLLRKLERTEIGTAKEGPVKIAGRLRLTGKSLRAPLSGRTCALYDAVVVEHGKVERVIIQDRAACDFLLDDGTGTAVVRAAPASGEAQGSGLELAIVQDRNYSSGVLDDATPELERFLSIYGEKSKGVLLNRRLSYREGVLSAGERVVVCGMARHEPNPDAAAEGATYRDRPTRLVIEPLAGKMHLSDEPDVVDVPATGESQP
jgi:hypothetical protein